MFSQAGTNSAHGLDTLFHSIETIDFIIGDQFVTHNATMNLPKKLYKCREHTVLFSKL